MRKFRFSGQTMVEFALLLPWMLLLLLGFFDLGRAIIYSSNLSNAVREATRSGIIMDFSDPQTESKLIAEVINNAFILPYSPEDITVTTQKKNQGLTEIFYKLEIEAKFCFVPVTPFIASIVGNDCKDDKEGIQFISKSVMHVEPAGW